MPNPPSHCDPRPPDHCWHVRVFWGFDYNPDRTSHHLAAYARVDNDSALTHIQFEPLNLGDLNGVLESVTANSQTGFLERDTPVIPSCHLSGTYVSNLHYSIRWPDGVLASSLQTGRFVADAAAICV